MIDPSTIALQLYTVREAIKQDFEGTVRAVASWGYTAVETAGEFGGDVKTAKALFDSLGLTVPSAHSPLPLGEKQNEVLDNMAALECQYLVCPWLDPKIYFQDADGIKQACDMLNEASAIAGTQGLRLGYHNHWFEIAEIDGKPAYQHMLDQLDENIIFELDTYWVQVGGLDPVQVMADMTGRLPLLHIKDGPADVTTSNMTAVG
ncbi:MAG TPA: sugar phosphate isomerase/epimerase, partial [Aggregatilineales bacterium]|nr:sugar phosphate isomerase/epimerase [Aggregatilineales bacterium]